jgi:hypothetical protein
MPKYQVLESLRHNGKRYKPGTDNDTVEMSETAAAKVRPGVLELVDDSAAKADEQKNTSESEAKAAGDQGEKAEGAGAPAAAETAAQPAGKKKRAK